MAQARQKFACPALGNHPGCAGKWYNLLIHILKFDILFMEMVMKKTLVCFLTIALFATFQSSARDTGVRDMEGRDTAAPKRPKIMLASVQFGRGATNLSQTKIEAAFSYATLLASRFDYATPGMRDSVAAAQKSSGTPPTGLTVGKALGVDRLYFVKISRLNNMLRADVVWRGPDERSEMHSGIGYCFLNYREAKTDAALYDPSLMTAIQRGMAVAERDSAMFRGLPGKCEVLPARTLVPGGIMFVDTLGIKPEWSLFSKKEINSYDAAGKIFEAASKSKDYVAYDIDTRDSIYAIFNLYAVENFNAPSAAEISALSKFGVESYVSGFIARSDSGATLSLTLYHFNNGDLVPVRTSRGFIASDDIISFRNEVSRLAHELFSLDFVPERNPLHEQAKKDIKKVNKKNARSPRTKKRK